MLGAIDPTLGVIVAAMLALVAALGGKWLDGRNAARLKEFDARNTEQHGESMKLLKDLGENVRGIGTDVSGIKADVAGIKTDVTELKREAADHERRIDDLEDHP
jgi:hypothetical protein